MKKILYIIFIIISRKYLEIVYKLNQLIKLFILKIELKEKGWIQIDSSPEVHQLYTLQKRRSLQTTRLVYGLEGMK